MKQYTYELLLAGGKVALQDGHNGLDACHRYADSNQGIAVRAWRDQHTSISNYNGNTIVQ